MKDIEFKMKINKEKGKSIVYIPITKKELYYLITLLSHTPPSLELENFYKIIKRGKNQIDRFYKNNRNKEDE